MKYYLSLLVFLLGCFVSVAEPISEDELARLKKTVVIGSVNDGTYDAEVDGEEFKYVELKLYTRQHPDDVEKYKFYMRVTLELTDKKSGTVVYSQFMREQGDVDEEYLGEDNWRFLVPEGKLKRPKVSAYAIEYGVVVDKKLVVLASEFDDVESADALIARTPNRYEEKVRFLHQYFYTDANDEDDWSVED